MLQELGAASDGQAWAIASLLFFVALFAAISVRVLWRKRGAYDAQARLPLDEHPRTEDGAPSTHADPNAGHGS